MFEVMEVLAVCAAIIRKEEKILIAQREEGSHAEYKWEFPGGKIEENESPKECIVREIREELNFNIEAESVFDVVYHRYEDRNVLLIVYNCKYMSGIPKAVECNAFRWVNINELGNYDFTGADMKIVNKLLHSK